jgi:quercetin dioxygenase-like cupin family protein
MPPWPDSLDALVAAPKHHTLLLENESVRVLDTRIPPGEVTPIHTHRWPSVLYVLSWDDFVRRDGGGNVMLDTRVTPKNIEASTAMWYPPLPPHSLENVGTTEIHVVSVEIKNAED